ncbi:dnaJ homolog subfamily C member 9-like [Diadema antillarum]|uniref:dnaJ homolog subfamily C member 9-like n=1 Tax=Diadema antillarum TaxID=105358 RepID=UPI003A8475FE
MSLLDQCEELFGSKNLYDVLMIKKDATASEVKKGYFKRSLQVHPDRAAKEDKDEATQKFQVVSKVYMVLSDKSRRNLYDESGEVDDEVDMDQQKDWDAYWRILFKKVDVKDIEEFEEKYRGSAEELDDLKAAYIEFEGDMDEILGNVMCSTIDDVPRFRKILKGLVKKGEVPKFEAFEESKKQEKARQKRAAQEAVEAEEMSKELGLNGASGPGDGGDDALKALILGKQKSREQQMDNLFASLEAKYCQPKKGKGKKQKR